MIYTKELFPGITLRCFPDDRFKQSLISLQILRPTCREEVAYHALLPSVLLRGTEKHPDLRSITLRLDDLYGAALSAIVRRIGDDHATGFSLSFLEDRYTMGGVLAECADFLRELLRQPCLENGVFRPDFVAGEKQNLITTIQSQKNDKRTYAYNRLMTVMCKDDPFGIPRLGDVEQVTPVTAEFLYAFYEKALRESRIDLFYVGSASPERVASLLSPLFADLEREYRPLPPQTPFTPGEPVDTAERMDVSQGRLGMGFTAPVTVRDPDFVPMQVCNTLLGSGMNSKLFMNVREKLSLCYDIGSGFQGSKGILCVYAGIDTDKDALVREKVLEQIRDIREGRISEGEMKGAKEALMSNLRGMHDSPGSIENYYATSAVSGLTMTPEEYLQAVEGVTPEQVAKMASLLKLHTVYFLKGVQS